MFILQIYWSMPQISQAIPVLEWLAFDQVNSSNLGYTSLYDVHTPDVLKHALDPQVIQELEELAYGQENSSSLGYTSLYDVHTPDILKHASDPPTYPSTWMVSIWPGKQQQHWLHQLIWCSYSRYIEACLRSPYLSQYLNG